MFIRRIQRRLLAEQGGFTLVELLVTLVIALVVFSAAMELLVVSMHKQKSTQARVDQLERAQLAESRLVRDLRQASGVTVTSATALAYTEPTTSGDSSVVFSCSSGTCTRTIGTVATTAIANVVNTDIFSGSPANTAPTAVTIKLTISAAGHTSVTLTDSVDLRNSTLGT